MDFKESITKEELYELPLCQFDGEISVIETISEADNAAKYLSQHKIIGFDTETKPSFVKGHVNKVALLQLSTSDRAFLFRMNKLKLPQSLIEVLSDASIIKPGVAIRDDIKLLTDGYKFKPNGFIDLQDIMKKFEINNFGLKKMAGIVLGFRISKAQQLSNWEADVFTEAQIRYAATDAWVAYEIYKKLSLNGFKK